MRRIWPAHRCIYLWSIFLPRDRHTPFFFPHLLPPLLHHRTRFFFSSFVISPHFVQSATHPGDQRTRHVSASLLTIPVMAQILEAIGVDEAQILEAIGVDDVRSPPQSSRSPSSNLHLNLLPGPLRTSDLHLDLPSPP